ncbi:cache domain-containing protein [Ideonella sp. A 288]|uniref:cache domain-containing protein n=1 Tax=Ideonella sp. A 288 TaxID=1962181 RepID=UPI000B4ADEF9|nr:cache domain-containing protein [Ideonella sp. A 288]
MNFTHVLAGVALTVAALAARAETPEAAKSLLDAAVGEVKASNLDSAVKSINAGGKWNKGSLYIVMVDFQGKMLAHSANDKMPGKNMFEAKDAAGKPFVQEAIAAVKGPGAGAVDIRWPNPQTKQIADATMFVKRVPGQDAYVGSVVFK